MKLPQLPDWRKGATPMPKLPELPDPRQTVQGPRGMGQGAAGIYGPKIAPMSNRRTPKKGYPT
jgi:hypothetical protein